jgi:hypothetical protein
MNFMNDKETYSKVHHLNMNKNGFEWDYFNGNILLIAIGVAGLTVIGLRLAKRSNNIIKRMNYGLIGIFLLIIAYRLIEFSLNSF